MPRCRPDGEVDVDSFHDLIFPRNSCSVIIAGRTSRSFAALHACSSAAHCGTSSIKDGKVPAKISSLCVVLADHVMLSLKGGRVKGVPSACPKWVRLRSSK